MASDTLAHPVLELTDGQIECAAGAFADVIAEKGIVCYACAILPDHAHLVIRRGGDKAEALIDVFQEKSRHKTIEQGHRAPTQPIWTKKGWKGFLNTHKDFQTRIPYVEENPIKAGRPAQTWKFVIPYDGWPY